MSQKATFGAGCFWGVEETFRQTPGVLSTAVGYEGGHTPSVTYPEVCTGTTGHAEVVELEFDPETITYDQLLDRFFTLHDPTTLNRQGPDVGTQYRSVVFYHDDTQRLAAESAVARLTEKQVFRRPIVTQIVPASTFHRAEDYHQQYLAKRGRSSCHI